MNTLSYGLLSLLSFSPYTGYDLTQRIQPFWPAKHSQIYPLLASLVKEGFVRFETVVQPDKPDKKVYFLNEAGEEKLREWLSEPADDPVLRDELKLKVYCLSLTDAPSARALLESRADHYREKLRYYEEKMKLLTVSAGLATDEAPPFGTPYFGSYVLIRKAIAGCESDLDWCQWVISLL